MLEHTYILTKTNTHTQTYTHAHTLMKNQREETVASLDQIRKPLSYQHHEPLWYNDQE